MNTIVDLPLDTLLPHPANSNRMPDALFEKLVAHLERTDRYPPVIVRPVPQEAPIAGSPGFERAARFQILDGHHRVAALRRLGRAHARCVIWEVDDDEALVLLATLNRLQGRDDPRARAELLHALASRRDVAALSMQLPETAERLRRYLALRRPPQTPTRPEQLGDMPVPVVFFLPPADRRRLDARLRDLGGPREAALMRLVEAESLPLPSEGGGRGEGGASDHRVSSGAQVICGAPPPIHPSPSEGGGGYGG